MSLTKHWSFLRSYSEHSRDLWGDLRDIVWSPQPRREVKKFLISYFTRLNDKTEGEKKAAELYEFLKEAVEWQNLPITPLSVTAFLFLWNYDKTTLQAERVNSFALLLDRFLNMWAKREVSEKKSIISSGDDLIQAYQSAAIELCRNRHMVAIPLRKIADAAGNQIQINPQLLINDRAFLSILRLKARESTIQDGNDEVVSFAHEVFYEIMLAKRVFAALRSNPDEEILGYLLGHNINKLARELFHSVSLQEKRQIIYSLQKKYYKLRQKEEEGSRNRDYSCHWKAKIRGILATICQRWGIAHFLTDDILTKRDNICYFWGRLEAETGDFLMKKLYEGLVSGNISEHPMIRGTIGTAMLLKNDADVEKGYLMLIADGSADDIRNRAYHRVYYGDEIYHDSDTFSRDDFKKGRDDWPKTRRAILKRLASSDTRAQALRGLDIVTFRRLCETRGTPMLEKREKEIIKSCVRDL